MLSLACVPVDFVLVYVLQDVLSCPVEQDGKRTFSSRAGRDSTNRTRSSDRAGQKGRSGPKNWSCDSLWYGL